ncbi:MAG: hypothetical protein KDA44_06575, partial [Planctomycetales bacterium]|nr:hypothetical protein [Planctomycetales bacterium]
IRATARGFAAALLLHLAEQLAQEARTLLLAAALGGTTARGFAAVVSTSTAGFAAGIVTAGVAATARFLATATEGDVVASDAAIKHLI